MYKLMYLGKIPSIEFYNANNYIMFNNIFKNVPNYRKQLNNTLILDYLILNDDRHFGNFGVNIDTSGKVRNHPIFDCGNSMFCNKNTAGIGYSDGLLRYLRCKPFQSDFDSQLNMIIQDGICRDDLINMYIQNNTANSICKFIDKLDISNNRKQFICDLIYKRINRYNNIIQNQ